MCSKPSTLDRVRPDGKININPRHTDDPYYRWTMPQVELKIESGGTVLTNLDEIAYALKRPVEYIAQFIKISSGMKYINSRGRHIIKGRLARDSFNQFLDSFIVSFVLCALCDAPGTDIIIKNKKKRSTILLDCCACGHTHKLDPNLEGIKGKLLKYILKNPPSVANTPIINEQTISLDFPDCSFYNFPGDSDSDDDWLEECEEEIIDGSSSVIERLLNPTIPSKTSYPPDEIVFESNTPISITHVSLPPTNVEIDELNALIDSI